MTSPIISEFIEALEQEINAIKNGKGGSIVKVFNGQLLREVSGLYIYLFHLESFLLALDDSPAEIEVNGIRYPAQIIVSQGSQVEISLQQYIGKAIGEARLHTNLWYLLELLKKKFIEGAKNSDDKTKYKIADTVFSGNFAIQNSNDDTEIKYSQRDPTPDKSQEKAIDASLRSTVTIIWGPPGTGKTATIAKAVEAHLRVGRRVLLVSHANNAVDQALRDIAKQMKSTSFYNDGKLVRLGIPPNGRLFDDLSNNYPYVLIDNIAAKLGETLANEKKVLLNQKVAIQASLNQIQEVSNTILESQNLKSKADALEQSIWDQSIDLTGLKRNLDKSIGINGVNTKKLIEARSSGKLKRFFRGLNAENIQREIDKSSLQIDSIKRQIKELETAINQQLATRDETRKTAHQSKMKCQGLLGKLGLNESQLKIKLKELSQNLDVVQSRIAEIDRLFSEIQASILREALFVATTLTKTFSSKEFPSNPFDVLILDEASMAPLPHFYWALGHCKQSVTIVGDFLQLPPICISSGEKARKWLGRSIFDILNINRVNEAVKDKRITLLDTQYRMHPEISEIPKRFFYERKIQDGPNVNKTPMFDGISERPLVLIDTSPVNPWCNRLSAGSRYNLYHALLCISIAEKILKNNPNDHIGIMTPYAPQARLIKKIAKDMQIEDNLRISTVHQFQGGQESAIIFDTVEAFGTRIALMLNETKADSDTRLILNVAFTRAKDRIYLIGHINHLSAGLHANSILRKIIDHFLKNADTIDSRKHLNNFFATDFEKWAEAILISPEPFNLIANREFHTEKNFYPHFLQDIKKAKERIMIVSPFLSIRRSGPFIEYFRALILKGIEIQVFTKPPEEQSSELADQANIVIEQLKSIGVKVTERYKIHNKTAIIDGNILWDGSLNILSHRDTGENMWRFEGQSAIDEVLKNMELDDPRASNALSDEICPRCGNPMIYKKGRFGTFLSCSQYPKCKEKASLAKKRKDK